MEVKLKLIPNLVRNWASVLIWFIKNLGMKSCFTWEHFSRENRANISWFSNFFSWFSNFFGHWSLIKKLFKFSYNFKKIFQCLFFCSEFHVTTTTASADPNSYNLLRNISLTRWSNASLTCWHGHLWWGFVLFCFHKIIKNRFIWIIVFCSPLSF